MLIFNGGEELEGGKLERLVELLRGHPGKCPLHARFEVGTEELSMLVRDENKVPICVLPSEDLCDRVEQLFGKPVLSFLA